ncbi:hypothetical protein [Rhodococcus sovatensis]|uniref:Uncharacterized protein n=1 Tax=Rhodococcus sovatensis TaxID=1805840 RepID=A0ABZ2PR95_9NOCA
MPVLTESSLPPSAYQRLLGHLNEALSTAMTRWSSEFTVQWGRATTEHDRERAMVQMRTKLARRLQLADHPSLPAVIRDLLSESAATDIRNLQQEIEDNLLKSTANASSDRSVRERLLKTARANSLTAILEPNFPLDALFHPQPAAPALERRVKLEGDSSDVGLSGLHYTPKRRIVTIERTPAEEGHSNAQ